MELLIQQLRLLQSSNFIFYTKAHGFHWNVEGILFEQFHEMFGDIYQDVFSSIDEYAEWIRIFGEYPAFDVMSILSVSNVKYEDGIVNNPIDMIRSLSDSNSKIIEDLKSGFNYANDANEQGVADFIASRITAHQKWGWKLNSSLKSIVNN